MSAAAAEISFYEWPTGIEKSFNIGTIRLLKQKVSDKEWDEMKDSIKQATRTTKEAVAIGSGGNINKVFSMSKKKRWQTP